MSTSTLCPSHEEVRQWADSFESLINHKCKAKPRVHYNNGSCFLVGCILFQDFLKNEYSDENIRFWFEVEEFKKMKPSKKAHARAQQIFDEYIREQAPNEVNPILVMQPNISYRSIWIVERKRLRKRPSKTELNRTRSTSLKAGSSTS